MVSFDDEPLILVDADDREIGYLDKAAAHSGTGKLHRAFSAFVFDRRGRLLLQRRAAGKRLWPGFWSNTCCSHPRRGETVEAAAHRRLVEELGFDCPLEFLFKFEYQAQFDADGAERELCWVFAGVSDDAAQVNPTEIEAVRYASPAALDAEIARAPRNFTPWFLIEWARIRARHSGGGSEHGNGAFCKLQSSGGAAASRAE
ncbi:MAG: isopentenyl-diphosphate Delta-isomerase [Gammaproteobacteria bacterium]|nr:isopentenyl-diphosphate Delta-isomerase [Gammaproteobacteria bacterium]